MSHDEMYTFSRVSHAEMNTACIMSHDEIYMPSKESQDEIYMPSKESHDEKHILRVFSNLCFKHYSSFITFASFKTYPISS